MKIRETAAPNDRPPKKIKTQNQDLNSSDLRRKMLINQVEGKFQDITCKIVKPGDIVILEEIKTSDKLLIEQKDAEQDAEDKESNVLKEIDENPNGLKTATIDIEMAKMEEKLVKRTRRRCRFYIFNDDHSSKPERRVEIAKKVEKVPSQINGKRPFVLVPGVQYDLGEGEAVETLVEDEEEVKHIKNEKYVMDSFCRDPGYLSDDETTETPKNDNVVSKIRQKKRALNAKSKLSFEKLGEPEIVGPLWWNGKTQIKELKKWTGIRLTSTPTIPTSFSNPVTPPPKSMPRKPLLPSAATVSATTSGSPTSMINAVENRVETYADKYSVKYFVKRRMEDIMTGGGRCPTSTPMVGQAPRPTPSQVLGQMRDEGEVENNDFLEKYVYKYFYKYKN